MPSELPLHHGNNYSVYLQWMRYCVQRRGDTRERGGGWSWRQRLTDAKNISNGKRLAVQIRGHLGTQSPPRQQHRATPVACQCTEKPPHRCRTLAADVAQKDDEDEGGGSQQRQYCGC